MVKLFKNSFSGNQSEATSSGQGRLNVMQGSKMDDLLKHYVGVATHVSSGIQKSSSGEFIPMNGLIDSNIFRNVNNRRDIRNILAMNPNAQLAIDIVVNGTLSPNNTLDSSLQYTSSYDKLGTVKTQLLQRIEEIVEQELKLNDRLPLMLRDAKYDVGSYAMMIIPTNTVRKEIDKADSHDVNPRSRRSGTTKRFDSGFRMESHFDSNFLEFAKTKELRGRHVTPTLFDFKMEDFFDKSEKNKPRALGDVLIHDDLSVLRKLQEWHSKADAEDEYDVLNSLDGISDYQPVSIEQMKQEQLSESDIDQALDKARGFGLKDVISIQYEDGGRDDDLALAIHVPQEAFYPNIKPGSPSEHDGGWVVLDMAGNPISIEAELDYYQPTFNGGYGNDASNSSVNANANFSSGNLELGYSSMGSHGGMHSQMGDKSALFTKLMDDKIRKMVVDGNFKKGDISISKKRELYEMMFTRLLSNKQTQMIYVPKNLICYMAFEYDENGNGESLLVKHKEIGTLNTVLTFANTFSAITNAIDHKTINVEFDEDQEMNHDKIVQMIAGSLAKNSTINASRMLNSDPNNQVDFFGQAGYSWAFANHPMFPGTRVTIDSTPRDRTQPDPETTENAQAMLIQALGSTPEVVDMARNVEFATSYFQSNLTAARRAIADQKITTTHVDKLVHAYVLNSPAIIKELAAIIDQSRESLQDVRHIKTVELVRGFIKSIETKLPKPDMVKVETLSKAIAAQEELVEKQLEYTIGEESLPEGVLGEAAAKHLEMMRGRAKAQIMREWMASNNMFRDSFLEALYTQNEEEVDSLFSNFESQQKFIGNALRKHGIITQITADEINANYEKVLEARTGEGGGSDGGSDFSSGSDDTPADDNAGGGDDAPADDADTGGDGGDGGEGGGTDDPFDF